MVWNCGARFHFDSPCTFQICLLQYWPDQVTPILSSNDSQLVVIRFEAPDTIKDALDRHGCTGQGQSTAFLKPS